MNQKEILCINITTLRNHYGLTQKKMAELLGIGIHSLRLLEKGILPPRLSFTILITLYDHFHILPSVILTKLINYDS